jgi:hypothetical protein
METESALLASSDGTLVIIASKIPYSGESPRRSKSLAVLPSGL